MNPTIIMPKLTDYRAIAKYRQCICLSLKMSIQDECQGGARHWCGHDTYLKRNPTLTVPIDAAAESAIIMQGVSKLRFATPKSTNTGS
jgi:hypothetical protein